MLNILELHYGLSEPTIEGMEGYASSNFLVQAGGRKMVGKVHPGEEAWVLQHESTVLRTLEGDHPGKFPRPIPTSTGEDWVATDDRIFRLLTYLEGRFLAEVGHTPELFADLGAFLARMDLRLQRLPAAGLEGRPLLWDLQQLHRSMEYLPYIPDSARRKVAVYFYQQYREEVEPRLSGLRKSIIQNDANDWNLLTDGRSITGLIDFGDMVYGPLVQELAVALTYALLGKADPLPWADPVIEGYHSVLPLHTEELDLLYYLIAGRLCMSVCNSAYAKTLKPESAYITVSEEQAWALLHRWLAINPQAAADRFRKAAGYPPVEGPAPEHLLEKRHRFFSESLSVSYRRPIYFRKAAFQYMYDGSGNTFLDAYNNIPLVGHSHPKVVEAGARQMARLNTNTRYLYEVLTDYAERLLATFPPVLNKVFLVNSGSAATDLALRMARVFSPHRKIAVLEHGYHGNTVAGIGVSHYKFAGKGGAGAGADVLVLPLPDTYRGAYRRDDGTAGRQYAAGAAAQIAASGGVAAFIAEPIVGCGGQVPLARDYLRELYPVVRAQGGLCISDEVQVGFGRLGSHFWGFESHGVVPDIVILGKPIANGHPMGAVVTTSEVADAFANGMEFFSSFGGNPVSCAIALAVLEVLEEEALMTHARDTGDYFLAQLQELQQQFPVIGDVRGSGLFLGIDLVSNPESREEDTALAAYLKNGLRDHYILVSTDGPKDNVVKSKPPLCFTRENADQVIDRLALLLQQKFPQ